MDILDEKTILEWASKVSKKYVSKDVSELIHENAEAFIKWLREAEEESSEEDDDDVEIEYDDRAKVDIRKQGPAAAVAKKAPVDDDEGDEIDIDDI